LACTALDWRFATTLRTLQETWLMRVILLPYPRRGFRAWHELGILQQL